jgi:hypothetical protein
MTSDQRAAIIQVNDVNGVPVTLEATQTEQLLHSDMSIPILLKKAEGEG